MDINPDRISCTLFNARHEDRACDELLRGVVRVGFLIAQRYELFSFYEELIRIWKWMVFDKINIAQIRQHACFLPKCRL